ncbi:MAG: type II secretion system protein [Turicibacter sp.]
MLRLLDHGYMNQTLATFKSDLNLVRQHNMIPGSKKLQLKVSSSQTDYVIQYSATLKTYLSRTLPSQIKIKLSPTAPITFNERGNISAGKTIPITSRYDTKNVVFSIGTGGLDIR